MNIKSCISEKGPSQRGYFPLSGFLISAVLKFSVKLLKDYLIHITGSLLASRVYGKAVIICLKTTGSLPRIAKKYSWICHHSRDEFWSLYFIFRDSGPAHNFEKSYADSPSCCSHSVRAQSEPKQLGCLSKATVDHMWVPTAQGFSKDASCLHIR